MEGALAGVVLGVKEEEEDDTLGLAEVASAPARASNGYLGVVLALDDQRVVQEIHQVQVLQVCLLQILLYLIFVSLEDFKLLFELVPLDLEVDVVLLKLGLALLVIVDQIVELVTQINVHCGQVQVTIVVVSCIDVLAKEELHTLVAAHWHLGAVRLDVFFVILVRLELLVAPRAKAV